MAYKYFDGNWHAYLNYTVTSISSDRINNTRTVRVNVGIGIDADSSIEFGNTYGAYIGIRLGLESKYIYFESLSINGSLQNIGSVDFTFYHDADGQATRTIELWSGSTSGITYGSLRLGSVSTSITQTFETIPRMSKVASVSNARKLGSVVTVNIDRKVSSFIHQVWYRAWNSDWIEVGKNLGNTVSFTPPKALANKNINATNGILDICVRTYDGTQQIGSDVYSYGYSIALPDDAKPYLRTIELADKNKATQNIVGANTFLQTLSEVTCKFVGAIGTYGSQVKSYHAEVVGQNNVVSKNDGSFQFLKKFGDFQVQAYITDSRGLKSNVVTINIKVVQYFAPTLSFDAFRSGRDLQSITVRRNCQIAPISINGVQKNNLVLKFQTSPANNGYLSDNSGAGVNSKVLNSLTNSNADLSGSFAADKSWIVEGVLSDSFTTVRFRAPLVGPEQVVMNYTPDGIGIGKIRERGTLDVRGDIYSNGELVQVGRLTQPNGKSIGLTGSANDMIKTGLYHVRDLSDLPSELNSLQRHGYLQVNTHVTDVRYILQIFTPQITDVMYMRRSVNSGWQPWVKFEPSSSQQEIGWRDVSFQNGWQHHPEYSKVQYSKTKDGVVYLRGSARKGRTNENTVIFNLPAECRPKGQLYVSALNYNYGNAVISIVNNGNVTIKSGVDSNWLNFDNISFKI